MAVKRNPANAPPKPKPAPKHRTGCRDAEKRHLVKPTDPPAADPDRQLNERERKFLDSYMVCTNLTMAAIAAGLSERTAQAAGNAMMRRPHVQREYKLRQAAARERANIELDSVIQELAAVGFANIADYAIWSDEGVHLRDSSELTRAQTAGIMEISADGSGDGRTKTKVKLHPKIEALVKLGQHLGAFNNKDDGAPVAQFVVQNQWVLVPVQVNINKDND